jgi:energy-coupling factor transport system permease protein
MIPTLAEESDRIIKAQKSRGADFEAGNLFKRARNLLPVVVPLFVSSFKRADELATAMEARCYRGGKGRTKMKPLRVTRSDWLAAGVIFVFCGFLIATRWL